MDQHDVKLRFPASAASEDFPSQTLTPHPKSLPTTLTRTLNHKSTPTEILVQIFTDRIFICITQLPGKVGSLLMCAVEDSVIDGSRTYNVTTLLGKRDDAVMEVYTRRITERIVGLSGQRSGEGVSPACPPILVGLAFRKDMGRDQETFGEIVDEVLSLYSGAVATASLQK